jgi:integrase
LRPNGAISADAAWQGRDASRRCAKPGDDYDGCEVQIAAKSAGFARYNFALVCQEIGLRERQRFCKHGRGPRIHDLRHTFAFRTIMGWYRKGLDPDREMMKLSTYLGHSGPDKTYWYIEAVPELLQLASKRVERSLAEGRAR